MVSLIRDEFQKSKRLAAQADEMYSGRKPIKREGNGKVKGISRGRKASAPVVSE